MKKILVSIIILIIILLLMPNISKAETVSGIMNGANDFINNGKNQNPPIDETRIQSTSNMIYNVLLAIGVAVVIIVGMILGIKFMLGSLEEKAEIKENIISYIFGCAIVFGAFGIWKIVLLALGNIA